VRSWIWFSGLHPLKTAMPDRKMRAHQERIDELLRIVADRSGTLLFGTPTPQDAPLVLACAAGHEWTSSWRVLRRGHWCRK
jgi:hypothetical protein